MDCIKNISEKEIRDMIDSCECKICKNNIEYPKNGIILKDLDDIINILANNDIDPVSAYQYIIAEDGKICNNIDIETGYVNASKLLKMNDKNWEDYYDKNKLYINEMAKTLDFKNTLNENTDSVMYYKNNDIYILKQIAIYLCQYISIEYMMLSNCIVFDYSNGQL
jgi:exoribonuclease II